jgi:hypothetical protein
MEIKQAIRLLFAITDFKELLEWHTGTQNSNGMLPKSLCLTFGIDIGLSPAVCP